MAKSASDALKKEKLLEADDIWMDDDWRRRELEKLEKPKPKMGFKK